METAALEKLRLERPVLGYLAEAHMNMLALAQKLGAQPIPDYPMVLSATQAPAGGESGDFITMAYTLPYVDFHFGTIQGQEAGLNDQVVGIVVTHYGQEDHKKGFFHGYILAMRTWDSKVEETCLEASEGFPSLKTDLKSGDEDPIDYYSPLVFTDTEIRRGSMPCYAPGKMLFGRNHADMLAQCLIHPARPEDYRQRLVIGQ